MFIIFNFFEKYGMSEIWKSFRTYLIMKYKSLLIEFVQTAKNLMMEKVSLKKQVP